VPGAAACVARHVVSRFIGDPERVRSLIGWVATADLCAEFERPVRHLTSSSDPRVAHRQALA
jgi:hypothetical protein